MSDSEASLYQETIHTFLVLYRYLRRHARQVHSQDMNGRKISALRHLSEVGPQTIGQLSAYQYTSDSSTSEMVAQLERASYVTRARSPDDQRVVLVDLTPAGRQFAENAPVGGILLLRQKLRALPGERLAAIHDALAEMVELLEIDND